MHEKVQMLCVIGTHTMDIHQNCQLLERAALTHKQTPHYLAFI